MAHTVGRHTVRWCDTNVEWTALATDDSILPRPRNVMWSYRLDGLTYFGFPFDPVEEGSTTTQRALNWLNRHHLILRHEHLSLEALAPVR
jgi:hypothetical protein